MGKDHTLFSLIDGLVKFEKYGPDRKKVRVTSFTGSNWFLGDTRYLNIQLFLLQVSVYPYEKQPENPNSYRARKRENFRLQRERLKARAEGTYEPELVLAAADASVEVNADCW